ncbi:type I-E CRISPR-associated protein Cse2/CasB [Nocardiopsis terrae]
MSSATEHDIRNEIRNAADRMARDLTRRVTDEPAVRATLRRGVGHRVEDPAMLPLHAFVTPYLGDLHERPRPGWSPTPGEAVERAFYAVATLIAAQPRQVRDRDAEHGPGSGAAEERGGADGVRETEGPASEDAEAGVPQDSAESHDVPEPSEPGGGQGPGGRYGLGSTLGTAVGRGLLNADATEQRLHLLCRQSLDGVHAQLPRLLAHARVQGARTDWGQLVLDLARWGGERDRVAKEWAQGFHRSLGTARHTASKNTETIENTNEEGSAT